MHLSKKEIAEMQGEKRLNLMNSISGMKPANLIGTISKAGQTNLAIFSSVIHMGTKPALFGLVTRPGIDQHTYQNILSTSYYTINQVSGSFQEQAHYTSTRLDARQSEFVLCGLTEEYLGGFAAPFVLESQVKMGLHCQEIIPVKTNGTVLIIGEVDCIHAEDHTIREDGVVDVEQADAVGVVGLNHYYGFRASAQFPRATLDNLPHFK